MNVQEKGVMELLEFGHEKVKLGVLYLEAPGEGVPHDKAGSPGHQSLDG